MRSNWLLWLSLSAGCGIVLLSVSNAVAQSSTTQPSTAQRYSRNPGIRVKAGVAEHEAFNQQAFSSSGPTVTQTDQGNTFRTSLIVGSLNVFFNMLNSLIAALQAAVAASGTPTTQPAT